MSRKFYLQDLTKERANNFLLIRLFACFFIVIAHGLSIKYNLDWDEGLDNYYVYSFANFGLLAFFGISGFLITGSILSRENLIRYFSARYLRLFPALMTVSIAIAFILGPINTSLPVGEYFSHLEVYLYPIVTGLTAFDKMELPGFFEFSRESSVVNTPIWTLKYELAFYSLTALFFVFKILQKKVFGCFIVLYVCLYLGELFVFRIFDGKPLFEHFSLFFMCYIIGSGFWVYKDKLIIHWSIALLLSLLAVVMTEFGLFNIFAPIAVVYACLWLAYFNSGENRIVGLNNDYSYGIYIIHWPVLGTILTVYPNVPSLLLIGVTMLVTVPLAMLSWHFIEKPAMASGAIVSSEICKQLYRLLPNLRPVEYHT